MSEKKIVARLTSIGVIGNIILVAFKLYAGIAGNSGAMVSDAIHSLSDVFATFIAFLGVRLAPKGPDKDHPTGTTVWSAWPRSSSALFCLPPVSASAGAECRK